MLLILGVVLGLFGAWYGFDFIARHWNRAGAWFTVAAIVVCLVVALPIGVVGVLALDGIGIAEVVRRQKIKEAGK